MFKKLPTLQIYKEAECSKTDMDESSKGIGFVTRNLIDVPNF